MPGSSSTQSVGLDPDSSTRNHCIHATRGFPYSMRSLRSFTGRVLFRSCYAIYSESGVCVCIFVCVSTCIWLEWRNHNLISHVQFVILYIYGTVHFVGGFTFSFPVYSWLQGHWPSPIDMTIHWQCNDIRSTHYNNWATVEYEYVDVLSCVGVMLIPPLLFGPGVSRRSSTFQTLWHC